MWLEKHRSAVKHPPMKFNASSQGAEKAPIFGIKKISAFSTKAQSRFVSVVLDLYLCNSRINARGELRAYEGRRVSSKSQDSSVQDTDKGVADRNGREKNFPDKGSSTSDKSSRQINDVLQISPP